MTYRINAMENCSMGPHRKLYRYIYEKTILRSDNAVISEMKHYLRLLREYFQAIILKAETCISKKTEDTSLHAKVWPCYKWQTEQQGQSLKSEFMHVWAESECGSLTVIRYRSKHFDKTIIIQSVKSQPQASNHIIFLPVQDFGCHQLRWTPVLPIITVSEMDGLNGKNWAHFLIKIYTYAPDPWPKLNIFTKCCGNNKLIYW